MENDLVTSISGRLRDLMAARNWNREKLLAAIRASGGEISDGNLGRLLAGKGNPTLKTVSAVAACFGLRTWELLATEEEMEKTLVAMSKARFRGTPATNWTTDRGEIVSEITKALENAVKKLR
jgi:transcriptional regulator with XRE-family HTH domain